MEPSEEEIKVWVRGAIILLLIFLLGLSIGYLLGISIGRAIG